MFERTIASQTSAMTVQFGRGEIATGLVSVISLVLVAFPAVGLCYVLVSTARVAFRLAARATRKHPALLAPLAAAVMAAAAGLTASWGLMPLSGHHPAAVGRSSLLPAAAPAAVGAVSSTSPPWPALVLDRRTGRPPAIEPRVPVRRHHRHRGAHAGGDGQSSGGSGTAAGRAVHLALPVTQHIQAAQAVSLRQPVAQSVVSEPVR